MDLNVPVNRVRKRKMMRRNAINLVKHPSSTPALHNDLQIERREPCHDMTASSDTTKLNKRVSLSLSSTMMSSSKTLHSIPQNASIGSKTIYSTTANEGEKIGYEFILNNKSNVNWEIQQTTFSSFNRRTPNNKDLLRNNKYLSKVLLYHWGDNKSTTTDNLFDDCNSSSEEEYKKARQIRKIILDEAQRREDSNLLNIISKNCT